MAKSARKRNHFVARSMALTRSLEAVHKTVREWLAARLKTASWARWIKCRDTKQTVP
jgi:hypothetical protein